MKNYFQNVRDGKLYSKIQLFSETKIMKLSSHCSFQSIITVEVKDSSSVVSEP